MVDRSTGGAGEDAAVLRLLKQLLVAEIEPSAALPWAAVVVEAQRQGVLWWLDRRLRARSFELPRELSLRLALQLMAVERDNLILLEDAALLVERAARRGIEVVPFKGIALLLGRPYAALEQRALLDIDVVVQRKDLRGLGAALGEMGYHRHGDPEYYRRHHQHLVYVKEDPARPRAVELHWTPFFNLYGDRERDRAAWQRVAAHQWLGREWRLYDLEDTLLSLALHLANHRFDGQLKWLGDLAMMRRLPICWPTFWQRAAELGALVACVYALELTERLISGDAALADQPLGSEAWRPRLRVLRRLRSGQRYGLRLGRAGLFEGLLIDQLLLDRSRDRVRQLRNKLAEVGERHGLWVPQRWQRGARFS